VKEKELAQASGTASDEARRLQMASLVALRLVVSSWDAAALHRTIGAWRKAQEASARACREAALMERFQSKQVKEKELAQASGAASGVQEGGAAQRMKRASLVAIRLTVSAWDAAAQHRAIATWKQLKQSAAAGVSMQRMIGLFQKQATVHTSTEGLVGLVAIRGILECWRNANVARVFCSMRVQYRRAITLMALARTVNTQTRRKGSKEAPLRHPAARHSKSLDSNSANLVTIRRALDEALEGLQSLCAIEVRRACGSATGREFMSTKMSHGGAGSEDVATFLRVHALCSLQRALGAFSSTAAHSVLCRWRSQAYQASRKLLQQQLLPSLLQQQKQPFAKPLVGGVKVSSHAEGCSPGKASDSPKKVRDASPTVRERILALEKEKADKAQPTGKPLKQRSGQSGLAQKISGQSGGPKLYELLASEEQEGLLAMGIDSKDLQQPGVQPNADVEPLSAGSPSSTIAWEEL